MTRIPTDTCLPGTAPEEWGPLPSRVAKLEAEVERLTARAEHARGLITWADPAQVDAWLDRLEALAQRGNLPLIADLEALAQRGNLPLIADLEALLAAEQEDNTRLGGELEQAKRQSRRDFNEAQLQEARADVCRRALATEQRRVAELEEANAKLAQQLAEALDGQRVDLPPTDGASDGNCDQDSEES